VSAAPRPAVKRLGLFLATFGFIGYLPVAPGTFGSAAGLLVYYLRRHVASPPGEIVVILGLFAAGVWSATVAEQVLGGTDPGPVVLDEVVGMLITLAFLPVGVWGALVGFLVFRILDVVKPWPSGRFELLHGGLGIMADDARAAVYGNLIMRVLLAVFPGWLS
jgi:phosphatidylglycerophosphatase A